MKNFLATFMQKKPTCCKLPSWPKCFTKLFKPLSGPHSDPTPVNFENAMYLFLFASRDVKSRNKRKKEISCAFLIIFEWIIIKPLGFEKSFAKSLPFGLLFWLKKKKEGLANTKSWLNKIDLFLFIQILGYIPSWLLLMDVENLTDRVSVV